MKKSLYILLAAVLTISANAQSIKSNLFYDALGSLNLGIEFGLGGRTSLDIPMSYNPWEFGGGRHWKHFLVQPGFRVWTRDVFGGHFFGVHGHWSYYNIERAPFSDYMKAHNFEGELYGVGVSWGHRWNFGGGRAQSGIRGGGRWGLETELGVGYARLEHDIYECGDCGDFVKHETRDYFGPTKVALNLIYAFGGGARRTIVEDTALPDQSRGEVLGGALNGFVPTFVVPDPELSKLRSDSIRADLEFVFNVAHLDPLYRDNAQTLRRLHAAVENIRRSRHTAVTGIRVTGFASPEGREEYNTPLSERRALSVRDYLEVSTGLPAALFSAHGEGERPDGLRAMVEVDYTVEPFSLDEARRVLRSRPQTLSLDEMFQLACTCDPEGREYREIFEIAAATFPGDDVANINAAAVNLLHGDVDGAGFYLERVRNQTPAWWDNVGIVFYLRGDMERASAAFTNAGTAGLDNAATLLRLTSQK